MLDFLDWAPYGRVAKNEPRSFPMSVEHVNVDGNNNQVKLFLKFAGKASETVQPEMELFPLANATHPRHLEFERDNSHTLTIAACVISTGAPERQKTLAIRPPTITINLH